MLHTPSLSAAEFVFYDINKKASDLSGEECERPGVVERKPHWRPAPVGQMLVLGKARERNEAPVLDPKPSSPMR
jgi:lipoprotein-anchoring transpeptidase ErfK/SrfK